jgi:RNA polymerase sigma factor (sigma-70 family)
VPVLDGPEDDTAVVATDEELLRAVRGGDMTTFSVLYVRHHDAALRAAIAIGGPGIAQDLVSESFTKVLSALLRGLGPDRALRPYLLATLRNVYVDFVRRSARELPTAEFDRFDHAHADTSESVLERAAMVQVMRQLPPRWSEILWRTVVLGEPLAVVAVKMGLSPNAAAALSFRARAGLRRAYEAQTAAPNNAQASGA